MVTNLEGKMTHPSVRSVRASPALPLVALDGRLQVRRVAQVHRLALERVEVFGVLRAEGEGGGGDGGGQAEPLDDLLPLLLVDHLHQASTGHHQVEQLEQVEDLLGHDWQPVDGGA